MTCDDGASFTMVTPPSLATTSAAKDTHITGDGKFVVFESEDALIENVAVSGEAEAYMYEVDTGKLEKVTNYDMSESCDTGVLYDKLVELHGEGVLANASVTRVSGTTSCHYGVKMGWFSNIGSMGIAGAGRGGWSVSDTGRFLVYTANIA